MDHKYKSLLQNLPCRHIIVMAESEPSKMRDQAKRLKDADLVNYFLVGRRSMIRNFLNAATKNMMFGRKYSWYSISKVSLQNLT